jgi:hypothetical protein
MSMSTSLSRARRLEGSSWQRKRRCNRDLLPPRREGLPSIGVSPLARDPGKGWTLAPPRGSRTAPYRGRWSSDATVSAPAAGRTAVGNTPHRETSRCSAPHRQIRALYLSNIGIQIDVNGPTPTQFINRYSTVCLQNVI